MSRSATPPARVTCSVNKPWSALMNDAGAIAALVTEQFVQVGARSQRHLPHAISRAAVRGFAILR